MARCYTFKLVEGQEVAGGTLWVGAVVAGLIAQLVL
jgi:hypothetical protein